jgi:hypothetical protein
MSTINSTNHRDVDQEEMNCSDCLISIGALVFLIIYHRINAKFLQCLSISRIVIQLMTRTVSEQIHEQQVPRRKTNMSM